MNNIKSYKDNMKNYILVLKKLKIILFQFKKNIINLITIILPTSTIISVAQNRNKKQQIYAPPYSLPCSNSAANPKRHG